MFTPGSKYFVGLTGLSLVLAVLYMFFIGSADLGAVALFGLVATGGTIAGFSFYTRDGDADTVDQATDAALAPSAGSFWPVVFAFGAAMLLAGLATNPIVFVLGLAVLLGAGLEWAIQNWAEGASADNAFNSFVRDRAISALDYPGLSAVGLGVIAFFFSRIMLNVSKDAAPIIFIVVAAAVLAVGALIGAKPSFKGAPRNLTIVGGLVALLVFGSIAGFGGERHELKVVAEEKPYEAANRECGEEASAHYDHNAGNRVAAKSGVLATIVVEDGKVYAQMIGFKTKLQSITVPRSNNTSIMFRNKDAEEHRLVANLGTITPKGSEVAVPVGTCTQLTGENQDQIMVVNIPKPSISQTKPYTLTVPGIDGEIEVIVP